MCVGVYLDVAVRAKLGDMVRQGWRSDPDRVTDGAGLARASLCQERHSEQADGWAPSWGSMSEVQAVSLARSLWSGSGAPVGLTRLNIPSKLIG